MQIASSAMATCKADLSASLYTATVGMPILLAVVIIRHAISPLLAISSFWMREGALSGEKETEEKGLAEKIFAKRGMLIRVQN